MKLEKLNFEKLPKKTQRDFANTVQRTKLWTSPGFVHVQYGSRRMRRALAKINRKKK